MVMKLLFYLLTYPYSFYSKTIAYQVVESKPTVLYIVSKRLFSVNETSGKMTILQSGCKLDYEWCATTPAISPIIYCLAYVLLIGLSVPLMHLNVQILYSKILGPIKQGTMQGLFIICGDILQVFGPILLTQTYQARGPKPIWLTIIAVMALILGLWVIFYNRMISSARRFQQKNLECKT